MKATLEQANGEPSQISAHINYLIKTQDLKAWRNDPEGFDRWLKASVCSYVNNLQAVIRNPVVKESLTTQ
jgi:hypothetical protein